MEQLRPLTRRDTPSLLEASSVGLEQNARLQELVADIRREADAFVFLSGGASNMHEDHRRRLLEMFDALAMLANGGRRFAVGDGGTQAGIMEAAGHARRASGNAFPLIGVAPAGEIPPRGATPIDPNHSHIVAIDNPLAPAADSWGSEIEAMYWLFEKLAEGRPSVAVVANGGANTLREVECNVRAGRRILLVAGSGRAADALASLLQGGDVAADLTALRASAQQARLTRRPDLFQIVRLETGAPGLHDAIASVIG